MRDRLKFRNYELFAPPEGGRMRESMNEKDVTKKKADQVQKEASDCLQEKVRDKLSEDGLDFEDEWRPDSDDEWEDIKDSEDPGDFEDPEDEGETKPFLGIAAFGVIAVLAALICVLLWTFTHRMNDQDDSARTGPTQESDVSEDLPETGSGQENDVSGMLNESETPAPENGNNEENAQNAEDPAGNGQQTEGAGNTGNAGNPAGNGQQAEGAGNTQNAGNTEGTGQTEGTVVSGDKNMAFREISETVTAKDVTNLRSAPSTTDTDNVVSQLVNGSSAERTGINEDTGWSRLEYQGQTLYAVSQYLTTDLDYKTPVIKGDPNRVSTIDGRVILFSDCDDMVTPKEYVNLRVEPSTSQGDDTVRCQLQYGESVHRTGFSPDSGWSRVEYNGEVLYVVSSMVNQLTQ